MQRLQLIQTHLTQNKTSNDVFSHVKPAPPDPIFGIAMAYKADKNPNKVDVCVGAYRDDNGKPYVFQVVRDVQKEIANDMSLNKEYLPIDGHAGFIKGARELLFGKGHPILKENRVASIQTLSGTGGLRVGFAFCKKFLENDVYVSSPTWVTHHSIITESGLKFKEYPYWDPKTRGLNFKGMCEALESAKSGSIILLHTCAHNPTGVDPTPEQWKGLAQIFKRRQLFAFFDTAYHGFATGNIVKERQAIEYFLEEGLPMIITYSFAKNFGLYGERIGALHIVCGSKESSDNVLSQLKIIIRPMYSNPPINGALIVDRILNNEDNFNRWEKEVFAVSDRIKKMRKLLKEELEAIQTPGNWDHIVSQIGMFSYTGLTPKQSEYLMNKHHIYLLKSGRISMPGITSKNVKYMANAIKDAVTNVQ